MSAKARDQRPRSILDAVLGEPRIQEGAAPLGSRRRHVLHHRRWAPRARRHLRAVVRQRRPLPAEDRRSGPQAGWRARFRRHLPDGPSASLRMRLAACQCRPARLQPRVLHQLRLGVGRDRAQDRARLSPRQRQRVENAPDRPRARLSRRQFRWHLGRRHRQQPQMVRHAC